MPVRADGDGMPINPNCATTGSAGVEHVGLPQVRVHDLHHGAGYTAHEAGAELNTLPALLGHSSIVVTADAYTSVCLRFSAGAPTTARVYPGLICRAVVKSRAR
jgi:hypothetical protein